MADPMNILATTDSNAASGPDLDTSNWTAQLASAQPQQMSDAQFQAAQPNQPAQQPMQQQGSDPRSKLMNILANASSSGGDGFGQNSALATGVLNAMAMGAPDEATQKKYAAMRDQFMQNALDESQNKNSPRKRLGQVLTNLGASISGLGYGGAQNALLQQSKQMQDNSEIDDKNMANSLKAAQQAAMISTGGDVFKSLLPWARQGESVTKDAAKNAIDQGKLAETSKWHDLTNTYRQHHQNTLDLNQQSLADYRQGLLDNGFDRNQTYEEATQNQNNNARMGLALRGKQLQIMGRNSDIAAYNADTNRQGQFARVGQAADALDAKNFADSTKYNVALASQASKIQDNGNGTITYTVPQMRGGKPAIGPDGQQQTFNYTLEKPQHHGHIPMNSNVQAPMTPEDISNPNTSVDDIYESVMNQLRQGGNTKSPPMPGGHTIQQMVSAQQQQPEQGMRATAKSMNPQPQQAGGQPQQMGAMNPAPSPHPVNAGAPNPKAIVKYHQWRAANPHATLEQRQQAYASLGG